MTYSAEEKLEYDRVWRARNRENSADSNRRYRERNRNPNSRLHYRIKTGDQFARLTAVKLVPGTGRGIWTFICQCGNNHTARGGHVIAGLIRSCGCFAEEFAGLGNLTHGQTVNGPTREYRIWANMVSRCASPGNIVYYRYGAAGISVCESWKNSFPTFLRDMGMAPTDKHSIDRYPDQRGNYEPNNCRWATPTQQCRNRSNTVLVTILGQAIPLAEACERYSVKYRNAYALLRAGRPIERIFGIEA